MLEYMYITLSRFGPGYPPSAAWYPGVQSVPTSTPQWFQQGGFQNYPSSLQGSFPDVGPKMKVFQVLHGNKK